MLLYFPILCSPVAPPPHTHLSIAICLCLVLVCRLVNSLLCTFVSRVPKDLSLIFLMFLGVLLLFVFLLVSVGLYSLVHVYSVCAYTLACECLYIHGGHASTVTLQTDKVTCLSFASVIIDHYTFQLLADMVTHLTTKWFLGLGSWISKIVVSFWITPVLS